MKFSQVKAFEKHLDSAAPDHFAPVYAVLVKDPGDRAWLLDRVKSKLLAKGASYTSLSADASPLKLMQELSAPSLFREARVIHVPLEAVAKEMQPSVAKSLHQLPQEVRCIFTGDALLKSSPLYKAIETEGALFEAGSEKPWERERSLTEWLLQEAHVAKKRIAPAAMNSLVKGVGGSYSLLAAEWEKLLLYADGKQALDEADVIALCRLAPQESQWALGEALLQCDKKRAMQSALRLLEQGGVLIQMLRQVRHQLLSALKTLLHAEEGTLASWMEKNPHLKGALLEKQLTLAKAIGAKRLTAALYKVDRLELKAKDGVDNPEILLTQLVAEIP